MNGKILIVDDDRNVRYSLTRMFQERGHETSEARNAAEAIEMVRKGGLALVLMDIKMPGVSGLEALKEIRLISPKLPAIIMTAHGTTDTAIRAMKLGAFDYVLKPFDIPAMWQVVEKALEARRLMMETVAYDAGEGKAAQGDLIVGRSAPMQEVYKLIGQVAQQDVTVLLRGDSGTGKELVARAIYHHSKRAERIFMAVNCAALPESLLESELFGHERGAFTGATARRIGKFEQSSSGTIFLDEVGDMSLATQAKLLRVLQEHEITRLGSNDAVAVDVRLIVATNKDLEKAIEQGLFREDLYYRLNVVAIRLPSLRKRREDIPELALYFLERFRGELGTEIAGFSEEALRKLTAHSWPGNVRELENAVKRACVLCRGARILPDELLLPDPVDAAVARADAAAEELAGLEPLLDRLYEKLSSEEGGTGRMLSTVERALIVRALRATHGNQVRAAALLGMNRNTLKNKMQRYQITISKTTAG